MKTRVAIIAGLLLCILTGCTGEETEIQANGDPTVRRAVTLYVDVPLMDLPRSRSIANDATVDDFVLWIFEGDRLEKTVRPSDTYTDAAGKVHPMITYYEGDKRKMKLMLEAKYAEIRIMMVANYPVEEPAPGITWKEAENLLGPLEFTYDGQKNDLDFVPLYGTSGDRPINVKVGVSGVIQLRRALAKVIIDVRSALDHFTLKKAYIYRANTKGALFPKNKEDFPTTNPDCSIPCQIVDNVASAYLTEIRNVSPEGDNKTCVIIGGTYHKGKTRQDLYFRLDFIRRKMVNEIMTYDYIDEIERNHCYIFDIDYLVASAGNQYEENARIHEAANKIGWETKSVVCEDANIMDITTDNYTFLGVTSGYIEATLNTDGTYYAANVAVATNYAKGWTLEDLPEGAKADMYSWKPKYNENVWRAQSVWIYLDKELYKTRKENVIVYFFSGNIRKSIEIILPQETENSV